MNWAALAGSLGLVLACSAPAPEPQPQPVVQPAPGRAELLHKTYERWVAAGPPKDCTVYFARCADAFALQAGFDPADLSAPNPKAVLEKNPDPAWITGWDTLPGTDGERHVVFAALTQAALSRNFYERCRADFDAVDLVRAEEAKKLENELSAIDRLENPYVRLMRLVTYRKQLKRRLSDPVGPRYDLELGIFTRFASERREYLYHLQEQRADDAGLLRPALPFEDERDAFCLAAGPPSFQDRENVPTGAVLAPISDARKKQLLERVRKSQDLEARLPLRAVSFPELGEQRAPEKGARMLLRKEALGVKLAVTKVTELPGGHLSLELAGTRSEKEARFDCKPTQKVERVEGNKVIYEEICKKRDEEREVTASLVLSEIPDAPIREGDRIAVIGDVTRAELTVSQAPVYTVKAKLELDVAHVLEIWRDTLLLADYFVQW